MSHFFHLQLLDINTFLHQLEIRASNFENEILSSKSLLLEFVARTYIGALYLQGQQKKSGSYKQYEVFSTDDLRKLWSDYFKLLVVTLVDIVGITCDLT